MKKIDPSKTIYTLVKSDEAILNIMIECGFDKIAKKGMIESVGRLMTLDAGIKLRKLDPAFVKEHFAKHGYTWEAHDE